MERKITVGIIVFDLVLTAEVVGPAEIFARAFRKDWFIGSKVVLIGVDSKSTIRTEEGLQLCVDATIADDVALDVLWVPGALDVTPLLQNEKLNSFIQKHSASSKWLGSLCAGAFILGQAGVLGGKRATTWFGGENDLQRQFPEIQVVHDQPVVVDHRLITANGGLVSYQAALVLLGKLAGVRHAKEVHDSLGWERLGQWSDMEAMMKKVGN